MKTKSDLYGYDRRSYQCAASRSIHPDASASMPPTQCADACNRISADLMISSPLWDDPSYKPIEHSYIRFDRK